MLQLIQHQEMDTLMLPLDLDQEYKYLLFQGTTKAFQNMEMVPGFQKKEYMPPNCIITLTNSHKRLIYTSHTHMYWCSGTYQ